MHNPDDQTPTALTFRPAEPGDLSAVLDLLREGSLRQTDTVTLTDALAQFDRLRASGASHLIVGEKDGALIACYQLTLIHSVSLDAGCRAQLEGVRVASAHRSQGIGAKLMADAEQRARAEGATLLQLMSNATRSDTHRFYARLGYRASHTGFKKTLA